MSIFFNWQESTDVIPRFGSCLTSLLCFRTSLERWKFFGRPLILQFEFICYVSSILAHVQILQVIYVNKTCAEFCRSQNYSHQFSEFFSDFNRTCNLKIYDLTTRCFKIALGVSVIKAKFVFFVGMHIKILPNLHMNNRHSCTCKITHCGKSSERK